MHFRTQDTNYHITVFWFCNVALWVEMSDISDTEVHLL